jgi:hypothetical protein
MKPLHVVLAVAALGIGACVEDTGPSSPEGSMTRAAEVSCLARASDFTPGGGAQVVSSDYSEAGTTVIIADQAGNQYRCVATNDGTVTDFQPM